MSNINTNVTEKLAELTDGLLWMSESDYPWQVFAWETSGPINSDQLLQLTNHPPDSLTVEIDIDEFFAPALTEQDWYNDEEKQTAKRYRALVEFLKYQLDNIQVYRVGRPPEIYIYIIGITRDENLAGISTRLIET